MIITNYKTNNSTNNRACTEAGPSLKPTADKAGPASIPPPVTSSRTSCPPVRSCQSDHRNCQTCQCTRAEGRVISLKFLARDPADKIKRAFQLFGDDKTGSASLKNLKHVVRELKEHSDDDEL